jgi:hypothetical protein
MEAVDFDYSAESPQKEKLKTLKNAWSKAERKRYVGFLKKNMLLFALSVEERKFKKINVLMSEAVRSRSPAKCHSYHQKMMIRFGSIDAIILSHSDLF